MVNRSHLASILLGALLLGDVALGADIHNSSTPTSRSRSTSIERNDEQSAREWQLSSEEWVRFRELMQGPLGTYSPNLDPLTVLGIEARSDEERRRYAELQVQAEAHRVEKLLAYQHAYDEAWQRLHPDMPRVILPGAEPAFSPLATASTERPALFVQDDCTACDRVAQRLQASGADFDIYVVGSRADDEHIRTWAQRIGIDPARVRSRKITLNHDAGRWLSLGMPGDLPALVRQVDGQWRRQ
ncbi:TIGR03759 family integrating conjugative element protein [Pseudomonas lopnurensis]|uniref:TIGR03759 family integrating conjugative element protein n=1 Tax=Pseudomonas lopnurensis TaxID=1477517 RepID=UPI0028B10191|nr:TIGR03759 family integrating conjugative element protein [Pseudomonas lopnurensis]